MEVLVDDDDGQPPTTPPPSQPSDDYGGCLVPPPSDDRILADWDRLSFYGGGPLTAAADATADGGLLAASPATASVLAFLEKKMLADGQASPLARTGGRVQPSAAAEEGDGPGPEEADPRDRFLPHPRVGAVGDAPTTTTTTTTAPWLHFTEEDLRRIKQAAGGGHRTPSSSVAEEAKEHEGEEQRDGQVPSAAGHRRTESPVAREEAKGDRVVGEVNPAVVALEQPEPEHEVGMGSAWAAQDKHFFILSDAGKPIYSRHGDEQKLCGLMGVMQGIFSFVTSSGDSMRTIYAGDHVFVFMERGPLYLVAIAKSGERVSVLRQQLEYLHLQIISTITSGITKIFESRPCFDLRGLLRGSTKFIDNLIQEMDKRPAYLMNATQCLPLKSTIRNVTGTYLQGVKAEDLVYALLIADGKIVNFVQPKKYPLQPEDLLLILNFLESSGTFRTNETWVPICLPKFNDGGYLYAYLCYLDDNTCLGLISTVRNSEKFYELAEWKQKIDKSLRAAGALHAINKSVSRESYRVRDLGVPGLISFVYRINNLHQFTMPFHDPPYDKSSEQIKVLRRYQRLWSKALERQPCGVEASPLLPRHPHALRQYYEANDRESNLVWVNSDTVLFILFEPWVGRPEAVHGANEVLRWVKAHESSLFILPSAIQSW